MKEIDEDKENVILINKADLLTAEQRSAWSTYFEKENVKVIFWSALTETVPLIGDSKVPQGTSQVGFQRSGFWFLTSVLCCFLLEMCGNVGVFFVSLFSKCCDGRMT